MAENIIVYSEDGLTLINVPGISEITISAKATSIKGVGEQNYAFKNAKNTIERVTFEENPNLESISKFCFYYCTKLSFVDISKCSKLTSIGDSAFKSCTALKNIDLPTSLTTVGKNVFELSGLTSIDFHSSLKKIGEATFMNCESFNTFNLDPSSSLDELINHQFLNTKITSIHLTENIKRFKGNIFVSVKTMQTITVDPNNKYFVAEGNVLYNKEKTVIYYVASTISGEFKVNSKVTLIEDCSFHSSSITNVIFPENLTEIRGWAFQNAKIEQLYLPASCKKLGHSAFSGCTSLTSIVFPEGLEIIEPSCFFDCNGLQSVILPSTLKTLGGQAFPVDLHLEFKNDSNLIIDDQRLILNKEITKVFQCASTLETIEIPATVEEIGENAFRSIKTIRKVILPEDTQLKFIRKSAFQYSSIVSINLSASLQTIDSFAFDQCFSLESIRIGQLVRNIGGNAFSQCSSLSSLTVDEGVPITINKYSFARCNGLTNIDFRGRIEKIGELAFQMCENLGSFSLSEKLKSIDQKAFEFSGIESCTFTSNVEPQVFPLRLFYNCTKLTTVNIPEGITEIGDDAFAYTAIDKIVLPKSCMTLRGTCFQNCKNVKSLTIPKNAQLNKILFGAFFNCLEFKSIENNCDNFRIVNQALFNKNLTQLIILPPNSDCKYFSFPETLEVIRISALQGCRNLHVIFLPESVTEIMPYAFSNCTNLRSINIPQNCIKIGESAFVGCKKMQCGISIENTDSEFRKNLIDVANMPKNAILDCDAICYTFSKKNSGIMLSSLFFLFLYVN